MPININQTSSAIQSRITDQLNAQSPDTLKTTSKFGVRVTNLFTSKAGIEKKNSQIAAKLLSTLTSQVGRTIADRTVVKLLDQRNVKILTAADLHSVIQAASDDFAKTLAAFTESPLTKDFLPGGSKTPANLSPSAHEAYTTSFISHCLAQATDLGLGPTEMAKYLTDGPSAGHADLYQKLEQLSEKTFPGIASHCESIGDKKFRLTPSSISYKDLGKECMKGVAWYGKPKEEAEAIVAKRQNGEPTKLDRPTRTKYGEITVGTFTDSQFISVRNKGFESQLEAQGFDNTTAYGTAQDKLHVSVNPEDMDKAFQVLFPLLTSPDLPFDELKFTNFECDKPGKERQREIYKQQSTEGKTPEIQKKALNELRMFDRVKVGNQFTFYCPAFVNPDTSKANLQKQKDFIQVLEQELKKAGVRPGDKTEGHELPNHDFTIYRYEDNPRIPSAQLSAEELANVKGSTVYQSFTS